MYRPRVFRFFCSHTRMISSPTSLYLSSRLPSFMLLTRSGAAAVSRTSCLTRFSLHDEGNAVLPGTEVPDPWLPRICSQTCRYGWMTSSGHGLDSVRRPLWKEPPRVEAPADQHDAERARVAPVSEALAAQQ